MHGNRMPKIRKVMTAEEKRKRNRENKRRTRIETRIKSMQYQAKKGCHKCKEHDPRKLEYDHKDPAIKTRTVSELITDGYPWSSSILRNEIRKCRILCANCHRVHTIKQQGYYAAESVKTCLRELAAHHQFKL